MIKETAPCIFCRRDASTSRSIAHIVPVSLGNNGLGGTPLVLPAGVECDECNNRFGRVVENHYLSNSLGILARFQAVPNRKGKHPSLPIEGTATVNDEPAVPIAKMRITPSAERSDAGCPDEVERRRVDTRIELRQYERRHLTSAFLSKLLVEFLAYQHGREAALSSEWEEHRQNALHPNEDAWLPFYRAVLPKPHRALILQWFPRGLYFAMRGALHFLPFRSTVRDSMPRVVFGFRSVRWEGEETLEATLSHKDGLRHPGESAPDALWRIDIAEEVGGTST